MSASTPRAWFNFANVRWHEGTRGLSYRQGHGEQRGRAGHPPAVWKAGRSPAGRACPYPTMSRPLLNKGWPKRCWSCRRISPTPATNSSHRPPPAAHAEPGGEASRGERAVARGPAASAHALTDDACTARSTSARREQAARRARARASRSAARASPAREHRRRCAARARQSRGRHCWEVGLIDTKSLFQISTVTSAPRRARALTQLQHDLGTSVVLQAVGQAGVLRIAVAMSRLADPRARLGRRVRPGDGPCRRAAPRMALLNPPRGTSPSPPGARREHAREQARARAGVAATAGECKAGARALGRARRSSSKGNGARDEATRPRLTTRRPRRSTRRASAPAPRTRRRSSVPDASAPRALAPNGSRLSGSSTRSPTARGPRRAPAVRGERHRRVLR